MVGIVAWGLGIPISYGLSQIVLNAAQKTVSEILRYQ